MNNNINNQSKPRESLSPIIHRKSSIGINYQTNHIQQYQLNFNSPEENHNNLNQMNNTNQYHQYESSSVQPNEINYRSSILSENTLSISDNPYLNINSTNDEIIPTK